MEVNLSMSKARALKDVAAVVGAIAGIVTGIEKVKSTVVKWCIEYKGVKNDERSEDITESGKPDKHRSRDSV